MKAVAINGSPRKGGNTEILLQKALAPLAAAGWETELIQLGGVPIRGCRACYHCFDTKDSRCGQKDEFFNETFAKMVAADAILLGSPTYFSDVSAEMKALLDRAGLVALANGGLFRGKIGAAVVAVRRGGAPISGYFYDWCGGLVWLCLEAAPDAHAIAVRAAVDRFGGHATLIRAADETRANVDVFHPQPAPLAALTRRVKESFDPAHVLERGRMRAEY